MKNVKRTVSCVFIGCLLTMQASAELRLHIDKNSIGFVQAYLENISDAPVTVVTDKLQYEHEGDRVRISPEQVSWQRRDGAVLLKSSLLRYAPVTLKPGQITYLHNPNIRVISKEVAYTIPEAWAELHETWSGTVEVSLRAGAQR